MKILLISTFILIIQYAYGLPRINRDLDTLKKNYAGLSSQIIATNLLKDKIEYNGNQVFSPLGISQILAILAEGAKDDVYKEFISALSYPENKQELREGFKNVLKNFKTDLSDLNYPAFKTWFYIYPQNSVKNDYKSILLDYYFAEIKNIKATMSDDVLLSDEQVQKIKSLLKMKMKPEEYEKVEQKLNEQMSYKNGSNISIVHIDDVVPSEYTEYLKEILEENEPLSSSSSLSPTSTTMKALINSKDVIEFEDLKKSKPFDDKKEMEVNEEEKDASKFDKVVDDKQYVEVPVIVDEMKKDEIKVEPEKIVTDTEVERKQEDSEKQKEINREPEKKQELPSTRDQKEKNIEKDNSEIKQEINKEDIKPTKIMVEGLQSSEATATVAAGTASSENSKEQNLQDNETIKDNEKLEAYKKDVVGISKPIQQSNTNEPEKISIPLKKLNEIIENHFLERRLSGIHARSLLDKLDIASSLSANSFVTRGILKNKHRMMLFSGLYYRGNWAYPFQELKSNDDNDVFYISKDKKIPVTMMRSGGMYKIADLERLGAQMIEFPYENRKYSLLVLLPKEKEGIRSLIENLDPRDVINTKSQLSDALLEISLPKFQVEQTTHSEPTLKRLGLKSIFSPEIGGLEDISEGLKMNVEEVVQHVNIRVDEGSASPNVFSATSLQSRSSNKNQAALAEDMKSETEIEPKKISIDRPFLYFILDNENDFIIIAGKILDPRYSEYDTI